MSAEKLDVETESEPFEEVPKKNKLDMRFTRWRWVMLCFASLVCFGNYFVYDNPSALQTQIEDQLHIDTFEFTMLYSVYSFPNIILPLLGGFFIDYVGVRLGITIFATLICVGQAVFALGCSSRQYWLALLGRIIFGFGGESLTVSQSAIVSKWFKDQELALALGINITVSRLGSVANDYSEPAFYNSTGSVDFGLWFGFGLCVVSLATGLVMNLVDKYRDTSLGIKDKLKLNPEDRINLSEVAHFSLSFWLITLNCLIVYVDVLPFNDIAGQFYQDRYGFSTTASDAIISITYVMGAIFCPLFGILVDRIGKRGYLSECYTVILSASLIATVHLWFVVMPDCSGCWYSAMPMVLLGIGYALYAAVMWASIPLVVRQEAVGTAFGVTTSVQNFGLAVAPMIMGEIQDTTERDHGYFYVRSMQVSVFLFVCGVLGVLNAIWLFFEDQRNGGKLNERPIQL